MKSPHRKHRYLSSRECALSLVELLIVIAIAGVLATLAVPALSGLNGANKLTSAAYTIQGALDQARTYAVANNTYTWVGIYEEDGSQPSQTPARSGIGRVVISVVASQDGTSVYKKKAAEAQTAQTLTPGRLIQLGKTIRLENVHILDASGEKVGQRPAGLIKAKDIVGLASSPQLFSFQYPLTGAAAYTFGRGPGPGASGVVQFNPQGEAVCNSGSITNPSSNLEIAIQEARGSQVGNSANIIALNIGGLTGQTTMYRP
jgi:prepilin-type N-terminal cleavage/methylation domain-containing protein